jgi:hypothetical protein
MPGDRAYAMPNRITKTAAEYIKPMLAQLELSRRIAKETLEDRKQAMMDRAAKRAKKFQFCVGDTVFLYKPVVVPGQTHKLSRPWAGPYYIVEKLSDIHVKLRRKSDNKLLRNRIHINHLKLGFTRPDGPDDVIPPDNIDAVEPAIISDSEMAPSVDATQTTDLTTPAQPDTTGPQQTQPHVNIPAGAADSGIGHKSVADDKPEAPLPGNTFYDIEKVLRKRYRLGVWQYRVKWLCFDNSQNSWVDYDDLSQKCRELVTKTHFKIPTDKRSQRKK